MNKTPKILWGRSAVTIGFIQRQEFIELPFGYGDVVFDNKHQSPLKQKHAADICHRETQSRLR